MHIENPVIFRILAYLRPEAFSESVYQAHSGIFNNDSYDKIDFLFFILILHTFPRNLKRRTFLLQ